MDYSRIWTLMKRSPKVLLGIAIGISLTGISARFPVLVEVNWGTEESRIKFDSRNSGLCEAVETVSQ